MPTIKQAIAPTPVRGRTTARVFDIRAIAALAFYGIRLPDDHLRDALDRIDADPSDFIADVRRQLANKRGLTDAHAIAGIDPDPEINRILADVTAFLDKHRGDCAECFPLPERDRSKADPIDHQQNFRKHLRQALGSPEYAARWLGVADEVLGFVLAGDFAERCAERGDSADEQALGTIAVARTILESVASDAPSSAPTARTWRVVAQSHRAHVARLKAEAESRIVVDWFTTRAIAERIGISPKHAERELKEKAKRGERITYGPWKIRPVKRGNVNTFGPWSKVCEVFGVPPDTKPPKPGPLKKPRKDKKTPRSAR